MVLDLMAIQDVIPHRYPFLLVDRILELEDMKIVGLKNVTFNEQFFQGHFPEKPVMPGVLIVEAIAQTAGIWVAKTVPESHLKLMLLASVENARFRKPVEPGDQLRIEVTITKFRSSAVKASGKVLVDGAVAAEADLMCAIVDRPGVANAGTPVSSH